MPVAVPTFTPAVLLEYPVPNCITEADKGAHERISGHLRHPSHTESIFTWDEVPQIQDDLTH
jgi:hypothetical protein